MTLDQTELITPDDLCGALNTAIYSCVKRLKSPRREIFTYDRKSRRIWFRFHPTDYITLILKWELLVLIGVTVKDGPISIVILGKTKPKSSYKWPLPDGNTETRNFGADYAGAELASVGKTTDFFTLEPHLYPVHDELVIYSSIVSETNFAGFKASIAKIVSIDRENQGRRMCITWGSSRVYRPLSDNHLSIITTYIRSVDNTPVDLKGHVRILMHIRKKRAFLTA